ncbi:glycerol kinase, variant [Exophiala mesophila]|uniref:glycerol kinase n=1 Tax=Exophiala mesophila TaxID=212818 RepID=A0A0D1YBR3_EXOME|nr:glycerol kinase [Exophiala mesophila]XP_016229651.1 glycerol kinase, variant [Exophiala mesophila]KIV98076.1 glycerol kinase [Exophiala mesophila]KIV98077.1 glycerol kinase, variant [Exophiala mesophila]
MQTLRRMAGSGSKTKSFVGSIDNGTTSSRFLIFDPSGNPVAQHQIEFKQIYPHSGWHEHDPNELVSSVSECIDKAVADFESQGHSISQIKAVGITNQRETTCVWDIDTGEPLYNSIVWTDTRTANIVRELKSREGADGLQELCGLPLSTYPSSTKLLWLLKHSDKVKKAYDAGKLAFGTVDSWLVYKLNGGPDKNVFVTDPTNASRTMFMNIHKLQYDDDLISFFQLDVKTPKLHLAKIIPSSHESEYGVLASTKLKGTKITGCLGDQSAALVGQCGFTPGRAKNTYGTGCFLLYNVGEKPVISTHGLLATVAYDFSPQGIKPVYALEGSIAVAGSSIQFLRNNLGFFADSAKVSELARTVPDNGGVVFVTAFSGLFAPYWYDDVKGTLWGITAYTEKGHIARATLEATCFQTKAILDAMEKDAKVKLEELAVDGGMSNSDLCMQTQADLIQIPVDRPKMRETTALGAAIAAGFAVGVWKNFDDLKEINADGRTFFKPRISEEASSKMYNKWNKAVEMSRGWQDSDDEEDDDKDKEKPELEQVVTKD